MGYESRGFEMKIDQTTAPALEASWISVKDRLPLEFTTIWIFFKHGSQDYTVCGSYNKTDGIARYCMHIEPKEYQDKITHWMPMPKPPKKESPCE